MTIREITAADMPELSALWQQTFGDSEGDVSAFFGHFGRSLTGLAAVDDGKISAAGYIIPAGRLVSGGSAVTCDMLYAIATDADFRGRGYGAALTNALRNRSSAGACVLCPAEDSLFDFYEAKTPFRDAFYVNEAVISKAEIPAASAVKLTPVSASVYHRSREGLLGGTPHIDHGLISLSYQSLLRKRAGGGLFEVRSGNTVSGCAIVERVDAATVKLAEVIAGSRDVPGIIAAAAALYPAEQYIVRLPQECTEVGTVRRRFGMSAPGGNHGWFGPAFD